MKNQKKVPEQQSEIFGKQNPELDKTYKTFRIACSNDVVLTKLEVQIIDTPEFQRLRKFYQLGTSYLVYPSAVHTRFEHSIGVLNEAQEFINFIETNLHSEEVESYISPEEKRLIRLTALLHDLANIPFGHTLEDESNVIKTYQEDRERFEKLLGPDTEVGSLLIDQLPNDQYELLLKLISAKKDPQDGVKKEGVTYVSDLKERAFIVDIVKNTVCADLLDYLKRDTYFCFLPLSIPDRFLKYLFLHIDEKTGVKRLAIRLWKEGDGRPRPALISELIQLLETRYFLAERVYFHHAKQISSAMLSKAVWHALQDKDDILSEDYLTKIGDIQLIEHLKGSNNAITSKLASALDNRSLYKRFKSFSKEKLKTDKFHGPIQKFIRLYHKDPQERTELEEKLSELVGLEPGDVIIYCPDPNMNLKLAKMNVTWRDEIKSFQEIDDDLSKVKIESIINSHVHLWQLQILVKKDTTKDINKKRLLTKWCSYYFENSYDGEVRRTARESTFKDIIRERNLNFDANKIDELLEHSEEVTDKDFYRKFANELIDKFSEEPKTTKPWGIEKDTLEPMDHKQIREFLLKESRVLQPHVKATINKDIDKLVSYVNSFDEAKKNEVLEDLSLRYDNESKLLYNDNKYNFDILIGRLRQMWDNK